MAARHAALPLARRRIVGVAFQSVQQPHLPADFFIEDGEIYVVHGFIKKTQKTPPADIALARRRLQETKE
jgi:hypothetical protein